MCGNYARTTCHVSLIVIYAVWCQAKRSQWWICFAYNFFNADIRGLLSSLWAMGTWGQCQLCPVYLPAAVTYRSKLRVMYILCSGFLTFIKYINYLLNSWWKYKYLIKKKSVIECNRVRLRNYRTRLRLVDYDYATTWKIWLRLQLRLRSNCNRLQSITITIVIDPNPGWCLYSARIICRPLKFSYLAFQRPMRVPW